MANQTKSGLGLSMVMMDKAGMRSAKTFCQSLQRALPHLPASIVSEDKQGIWALKVGHYDVYLALMPAPIPWSQLDTLTQAAWHWKEAAEILKGHRAHILITITNAPPDPLDADLLLTKVTAAVLEVQESLGVLWGGPAICSRTMFISEAKDAARDKHLPVLSWMSFNMMKEQGQYVISTQGMGRYGQMELDLWGDSGTKNAVELALDLAVYVLKGAVLKPGQTFGRTAQEKFKISHGPWAMDNTKTALQLDMRSRPGPPLGAKKSFFGRLFG